MGDNPTTQKTMMVNCINVNQSFNLVTPPDMNPPVMPMMCSRCHFVHWLRPGAQWMECNVCQPNPNSAPLRPPLKRAVICGISYQQSSHELKGSIDDAKSMKDLLMRQFGFLEFNIVMLTDKDTNPVKPTKNNLLRALYWLGQGCQQGDSLVFHYSGHGLRLRNYRLTEVDGYNETLCPMDFEKEGMIFDDEINAVLVGHLPLGVKLHAIIDSRHRNSVLDLQFLCRRRTGEYPWTKQSSREFKGTSGGNAISFSRSVDVQTSADFPLLSKTTSTGSLTSCFIKAINKVHKRTPSIEDGHKRTYSRILDYMHTINPGGNLRQEPLLAACGEFNVKSEIFSL